MHMTNDTDLNTKSSCAVGATDEVDGTLTIAGSGFPGLPSLICSGGALGFVYHGVHVHSRERQWAWSMSDCSQELGLMINAIRDVFSVSLRRFFWPPTVAHRIRVLW